MEALKFAEFLAGRVAEQLPNHAPNYVDAQGKLYYVEITKIAASQFAWIKDGFHQAGSGNLESPMPNGQRKGLVVADGEEQEGTEGLIGVGRFTVYKGFKGTNVIAYSSDSGILLREKGAKKGGYAHALPENQLFIDGKVWHDKVMQLTIQVVKEYSVGLLLTEKQKNVAEEILGTISSYGQQRINEESDSLEIIKNELETEQEAHDKVKKELGLAKQSIELGLAQVEEEKRLHVQTKEELNAVKGELEEAQRTLAAKVKKPEKKEASVAGGYVFFSGFAVCLVLTGTAYAIKMGYLKVPQGVQTWMSNKSMPASMPAAPVTAPVV